MLRTASRRSGFDCDKRLLSITPDEHMAMAHRALGLAPNTNRYMNRDSGFAGGCNNSSLNGSSRWAQT